MIKFKIKTDLSGKPREVEVCIYDSLDKMRKAIERYDKKHLTYQKSDAYGVTHMFKLSSIGEKEIELPLAAIIRLARTHLTAEIIAHEACHAALWLARLDKKSSKGIDFDETICYITGLIAQTIVNEIDERV